jgi:hypothetical protein
MTDLSNLIQRDQFAREVLKASLRKSVLFTAGVIANDAELSRLMNANAGSVFEFDYFNDLADNEGRISDDSETDGSSDSITTGSDRAVGNYRNRSWGAKNITANLSTTGDPMMAITGRIGAYWGRQMDFTTIAITNGIIAGNAANDGSDMVNNQTGVQVDINMILDTVQTSGDMADYFTTLICHSAINTSLKKQGVTDKIYDANTGAYLYEALAGLRIVITDSVTTGADIPGGAAGDYLSYVTGPAFMGYGEGTPKRANELHYQASTGNGAGSEAVWSRKNFSIHPYGFSFTSASMVSTSPTNAEFGDATNWVRNADRKRVPFAGLICTN